MIYYHSKISSIRVVQSNLNNFCVTLVLVSTRCVVVTEFH
jgi:hypothetical protein